MNVPEQFSGSKALQYVISKGWKWKASDDRRIELSQCPFCKKDGYGHFYMICESGSQDGLWACHKCGKSSHLNNLKEEMGDKIASVSDFGAKGGKVDEMPDIESMHEALLGDADVLDYLVNQRGFSMEIIKQQKLGVTKRWFRKSGEVKALAYPYLVGDQCVFVHFRTLPPAEKDFISLKGWDAPLYNGQIIKEGLKDITFFEGEANTIVALDHKITNVVGVPGANFKKAMWLEQFDELEIEKVYICYDKDKVGQKAAQTLASRIGINKCYKVVLPDFSVPQEDGTSRPGKDLNEWFSHGGGTAEKFEELRLAAPKFDVDGVTDITQGLAELKSQLEGKQGMMPKYMMPWPCMRSMIGLEDGDVLDIIAQEKIGKSTFGMNIMEFLVDTYAEDGIIICLEMPNLRQMQKWVSHVAQVEDRITNDIVEAEKLKTAFLGGIEVALAKHQGRAGNLYFCYPTKINTLDDMEKLIVDCIRRYGVKFVMLDNLQLISKRTLKNDQRTIHLDRISGITQRVTKDYGTVMIRIIQPHQIRTGMVCTSSDADGASQIAKDCDGTISLNRARKGDPTMDAVKNQAIETTTDASFERKMRVSVDISRYSPGGSCDLDFVGQFSTVREYNAALIASEEAQKKVMDVYDKIGVTEPGCEGTTVPADLQSAIEQV